MLENVRAKGKGQDQGLGLGLGSSKGWAFYGYNNWVRPKLSLQYIF